MLCQVIAGERRRTSAAPKLPTIGLWRRELRCLSHHRKMEADGVSVTGSPNPRHDDESDTEILRSYLPENPEVLNYGNVSSSWVAIWLSNHARSFSRVALPDDCRISRAMMSPRCRRDRPKPGRRICQGSENSDCPLTGRPHQAARPGRRALPGPRGGRDEPGRWLKESGVRGGRGIGLLSHLAQIG
jgi:hypothetical protein